MEVSIKTRLAPASLSFKGQATKQETVKWSILNLILYVDCGWFASLLYPMRFFMGPTDFLSCQKNKHFIGLI